MQFCNLRPRLLTKRHSIAIMDIDFEDIMKKQKIWAILYIVIAACSLFAFMGVFFLLMRKQFTATAFINYWLTFALALSAIFVFYHLAKKIFKEPKKEKTFYNISIEWLWAWMAILLLVVAASLICWQDYFVSTFIPKLTVSSSQLGNVIKLFIPTAAILVLLTVLVLPQFLFLLHRAMDFYKAKRKTAKQ